MTPRRQTIDAYWLALDAALSLVGANAGLKRKEPQAPPASSTTGKIGYRPRGEHRRLPEHTASMRLSAPKANYEFA